MKVTYYHGDHIVTSVDAESRLHADAATENARLLYVSEHNYKHRTGDALRVSDLRAVVSAAGTADTRTDAGPLVSPAPAPSTLTELQRRCAVLEECLAWVVGMVDESKLDDVIDVLAALEDTDA